MRGRRAFLATQPEPVEAVSAYSPPPAGGRHGRGRGAGRGSPGAGKGRGSGDSGNAAREGPSRAVAPDSPKPATPAQFASARALVQAGVLTEGEARDPASLAAAAMAHASQAVSQVQKLERTLDGRFAALEARLANLEESRTPSNAARLEATISSVADEARKNAKTLAEGVKKVYARVEEIATAAVSSTGRVAAAAAAAQPTTTSALTGVGGGAPPPAAGKGGKKDKSLNAQSGKGRGGAAKADSGSGAGGTKGGETEGQVAQKTPQRNEGGRKSSTPVKGTNTPRGGRTPTADVTAGAPVLSLQAATSTTIAVALAFGRSGAAAKGTPARTNGAKTSNGAEAASSSPRGSHAADAPAKAKATHGAGRGGEGATGKAAAADDPLDVALRVCSGEAVVLSVRLK